MSVLPDQHVTATTAADGTFSLTVPVGIYTVVFTMNPGITTTQVTGVSVVAGGSATVNQSAAYTPIALTVSSAKTPAGFGTAVNLAAATTGATGPVTYTWTLTSGPYTAAKKPTLTGTATTATFTTNEFADILASAAVHYPPILVDPRPGFIPLSFNQLTQMSYLVTVTATDGKYAQTATTKVVPAIVNAGVIAQGSSNRVPVGIMLIGNDPTASSWAWVLTPPAGAPAAILQGANTQYPTFTPTGAGVWTLSSGATTLTVSAGTYLGMGKFIDPTADNTMRCSTCHLRTPPSVFATWTKSAHGDYNFRNPSLPVLTMFQRQVGSGHYSGECLACHAVGFTAPELFPAATPVIGNHGFADTMEETGWSIPTVASADVWAPLDPNLKALAGVQCESCHGPLSTHFAGPGIATAPSGTFSAATCLVCHDEPGHHEEVAMWVRSPTGHSNAQMAIDVATESANCARCHSAQGFVSWREQIGKGVAGDQSVQIPPNTPGFNATANYLPATTAYLDSIGLDAAHVQPQTCQACHNSHGTALRFTGSTGMLPAGFSATGVGKGALCMSCHNSRVGAHGEGLVTDEHAPHTPTQADVLMGQNAYFVPGFNLSKHAYIADSCVGCHMKFYPASLGTMGGTGIKYGNGVSHTFKADASSLCQNCHANLTGTALQGEVRAALASVQAAILAKINLAVNPTPAVGLNRYWVVAQYDGYDPTGTIQDEQAYVAVQLDMTNPIVAVEVKSYHPNKALVLTLKNPMTVTWAANDYGAGKPPTVSTTTTKLTVFARDIDVSGSPIVLDAAGNYTITKPVIGSLVAGDSDYTTMSKALWNYLLVGSDGSYGIHNPSFALNVLSATQAKVEKLTAIPY